MTALTLPRTEGLPRIISDHIAWVCAIWLHLAVYSVLMSQPKVAFDPLKLSDPVQVELIPFSEFLRQPTSSSVPSDTNTASEPTSDADSPEVAAATPELQANVPNPQTWVAASRFLAADILKDKSNTKARRALATLVTDEKWTQLCALEAMEQVQLNEAGFQPIQLVPHAVRNAYRKENRIVAPAGALLSKNVWYEIAYRCQLDDTGSDIVAFEYALGDRIPLDDWGDLGLPHVH
ncbi:MAG: DUF930 domain-containing protein [Roseibium sp.]